MHEQNPRPSKVQRWPCQRVWSSMKLCTHELPILRHRRADRAPLRSCHVLPIARAAGRNALGIDDRGQVGSDTPCWRSGGRGRPYGLPLKQASRAAAADGSSRGLAGQAASQCEQGHPSPGRRSRARWRRSTRRVPFAGSASPPWRNGPHTPGLRGGPSPDKTDVQSARPSGAPRGYPRTAATCFPRVPPRPRNVVRSRRSSQKRNGSGERGDSGRVAPKCRGYLGTLAHPCLFAMSRGRRRRRRRTVGPGLRPAVRSPGAMPNMARPRGTRSADSQRHGANVGGSWPKALERAGRSKRSQTMKDLIPMPLGGSGQHQGTSHAAKHYLAPGELWEDVAQDVEPQSRPAALLSGPLAGVVFWSAAGELDVTNPVLRVLERAYVQGYLRVVDSYLKTGVEQWRPHHEDHGVSVHHLGDGILLELYHRGGELHMRTAYRPLRSALSSASAYALIPKSLEAMMRRLRQARSRAERVIARRPEGVRE